MTAPPRRWARWTFETPNAAEVAQVARSHGMRIISWTESAGGIFTSFALWGIRLQLAATEEQWTRMGIKWHKRQPIGAEPAPPLLRRKEWRERDWERGLIGDDRTDSTDPPDPSDQNQEGTR